MTENIVQRSRAMVKITNKGEEFSRKIGHYKNEFQDPSYNVWKY